MESHHLIAWIVIGLLAGFLAARLVEGQGLGCLMNTVVGVAGAVIGGILIEHLAPDTHYGFAGSVVVAFIGACLFLGLLRILGITPRRQAAVRRRR